MFWKCNANALQIEALITKENATLQEVLEFEEVINECRASNKILIDFLQKPEVMEELVTLITKEPSIEVEERTRFKYPNIACELLTCDVPALNERLASDKVLLDKLYTFLECEPPLNPLLASYFSKVIGVLIAKKSDQNWLSYQFTCLQVLDFLKAKDTFISLLLKHLGTSAIMDIMLKLMTQVEGMEMRQNILNWLDSQQIMQSLVSLLNPKEDKERHYNVAQLLCDFIRVARDTQRNSTERCDPDPLLKTLESSQTVTLLLDNVFSEEKSETAIVGGIQVLLSLLDVYQSSVPKFNSQTMYNSNINEEACDIEQNQKIIFNTTQAIRTRVKDFHNILLDPPSQKPILTTVGLLNPPLGNTRLQVSRLFASLMSSSNEELLTEIETVGTFSVLLDMFFNYQWNNFLHTQVETCLIQALKNNVPDENDDNSNALSKHLLVNCRLIERILEAWKENDEHQAQEKGIRKGYMGHLISMVNKIVELCATTSLGKYLKDILPDVAKSLDEFKETRLEETNSIQDFLLGGAHPVFVEDNENYGDVPFAQSSALQQQLFTQYQVQNLAPYVEGYSGFNDDAFTDGDNTLQTVDHRTDMNFDLSEGDLVQQQEIFKQVCAQNINTLDDADDQIFEEREHTFQTVIEKRDRNEAVYSSDNDSDGELPSADDTMDIDPWSSPKPVENVAAPIVAADPWSSDLSLSSDATVGGWADFSLASFEFAAAADDKENKQPVVTDDSKVDAEIEKIKLSKDLTFNQVDGIAQTEVAKPIVGDKVKSAAGDLGDQPVAVTLEGNRKALNTVVAKPSKSIEGDSGAPESTDKIKVEKGKV